MKTNELEIVTTYTEDECLNILIAPINQDDDRRFTATVERDGSIHVDAFISGEEITPFEPDGETIESIHQIVNTIK